MRKLSDLFSVYWVLAPALALTVQGCSAVPAGSETAPEETTEETGPVLEPLWTIEIDADRSVQFFELDPGLIVNLARTRDEAARGELDFDFKGSPTEVHRRLRPGEPVPQPLVDATARQRAYYETHFAASENAMVAEPTRKTPVILSSIEPAESIVPKHSSDAWFRDTFCTTDVLAEAELGSVETCYVNRTGGGSTRTDGVWEAVFAAASYRGTIRMKMKAKQDCTSTWSVFPNIDITEGRWYRQSTWLYPWTPIDVVSEISNATDDGYHRAVIVGDIFTCRSGCYYNGSYCSCPVPWSPPPGWECGGDDGSGCGSNCSWDGSVCKCGVPG